MPAGHPQMLLPIGETDPVTQFSHGWHCEISYPPFVGMNVLTGHFLQEVALEMSE